MEKENQGSGDDLVDPLRTGVTGACESPDVVSGKLNLGVLN